MNAIRSEFTHFLTVEQYHDPNEIELTASDHRRHAGRCPLGRRLQLSGTSGHDDDNGTDDNDAAAAGHLDDDYDDERTLPIALRSIRIEFAEYCQYSATRAPKACRSGAKSR